MPALRSISKDVFNTYVCQSSVDRGLPHPGDIAESTSLRCLLGINAVPTMLQWFDMRLKDVLCGVRVSVLLHPLQAGDVSASTDSLLLTGLNMSSLRSLPHGVVDPFLPSPNRVRRTGERRGAPSAAVTVPMGLTP